MGRLLAGGTAVVALLLAAFSVAGCGSSDGDQGQAAEDRLLALETVEPDSLRQYRLYLEAEVILLGREVEAMRDEIATGDFGNSSYTYANARVHFNHLLPAAALLGPLAAEIDGQAGAPDNGGPSGLHGIEQALFGPGSKARLEPMVIALTEDVRALGGEIARAELSSPEIARASGRLMEEVTTGMVRGEEEPYARIDMVDVSAAVEGAERAFEALRPGLASADAAYVLRFEEQAIDVYQRLTEHGSPARESPPGYKNAGATSFVPYGDFNQSEIERIAGSLERLEDLVLELPGRVGQS